MKKSKKAGLILTVGAALFLAAGAPALADETDTISKNVYIGGVNVSGMTEEQATKAVEEKLGKGTGGNYTVKIGDETTTATAENFGMEWTNREVVHEAMEVAKGGNLIKQYKDKKDLQVEPKNFEVAYAPNEQAVKTYVEKLAEEYNRDAEEGDITFANGYPEVTGGETGIAVNVDQSVSSIMKALEGDGTELTVVAEVQKPSVTKEELSQVKDVLGTATTYYGSSYERNTNVEVGASKINGTLIMPGETFSVTAAVTPFNADNGYYPAPSYESGQVVDTYGGGICQVSTTLYNAVLRAELEVTERHNHSMIVTYVDPSADAAIAESSGKDFVFVNNTDYPIYIDGHTADKKITFTIYGVETRAKNRAVDYESEVVEKKVPEADQIIADASQPIGVISVSSAHIGYKARLWKIVKENGVEVSREQVNSSNYKMSPRTATVGIASPDPNATSQMQAAIATSSIDTVKATISNIKAQQAAAAALTPEQLQAIAEAQAQAAQAQQDAAAGN